MRIVIRTGLSERLFAVTNLSETTTLAQVLEAAQEDERNWSSFWVDDKPCARDDVCASIPLLEGSVISNTEPEEAAAGWHVYVVGGEETSAVYPLPHNGLVRLGRSPEADIVLTSVSVSWSHAIIKVDDEAISISDDNSSNSTFVDGKRVEDDPVELQDGSVISLGGACLQIVKMKNRTDAVRNVASATLGGVMAFNRPPRPALPKTPDKVDVPFKKEPHQPMKFSWISVLAPLLMAGAMVAVMGSIRYAFIALLSPVMAVGSWWEQKRRAKGSAAEEEANFVAALETLEADIAKAAVEQRHRLRTQLPYPHDCIQHAKFGTAQLWQVRTGHEDYWSALLGTATISYDVPVEGHGRKHEPRAQRRITAAAIPAAPVEVDFSAGPVGIWGDHDRCLEIARSLLCQLSTRTGPADMGVGIFATEPRRESWRWTAWLPHTQVGGANPNNRWLGFDQDSAQSMLRSLRDNVENLPMRSLLLVIDNISLLEGRESAARDLLSYVPKNRDYTQQKRKVSGIVIAEHPDQLPASCHTVIEALPDSEATLTIPSRNSSTEHIITSQIDLDTAHDWARSLARFDDPERREAGGSLPSLVHLFDLLELDRDLTGQDIAQLWQTNRGFSVPLGVCEDGLYWFDLVKDGPHGLVGGTTGSGKSELLRSLVAGLAARISPKDLTFILVDFKGGAAFASLDQIPHTIGTLSNLEPSLAYRALRALEAEMVYRQERFAAAGEGIDNLDAYLATNPSEPMARLLVVVDEFAQLAKEYPDVLSSLVSIGAVGRTLGVHMILATQRPAGVVNDDILANTNMRTALRVQSREDSSNVISVPHAASIGREQKGRAYIKLGEEDITPIQTALVTGISGQSEATDLFVDEIVLGFPPPLHAPKRDPKATIDLDLLIAAINQAHAESGYGEPRPVWPTPLGDSVELKLDEDPASTNAVAVAPMPGDVVVVGLADDPDHQRQYPTGWNIDEGNVVIAGIPGSGTTTTLTSLALSLAATRDPEYTDFLYLDLGTHGLLPLSELPQSRGYAGPGSANQELQQRLLRYLREELERRTAFPGKYPDLFVFIDGLATLREEYDDYDSMDMLQAFYQVWAKGPALGIHCAATTTRLKALPSAIDEVTTQKWLFRLTDPYDYATAGIMRDNIPQPVPGRYVDIRTRHHAHIATPERLDDAVSLIAEKWGHQRKPALIALLPSNVAPQDLTVRAAIGVEPWLIPVGVAEATLQDYCLEAWSGEHLLIAGPARSGKSTVAEAIATKLLHDAQQQGIELTIVGTCSRRSPLLGSALGEFVTHDQAASVLAKAEVATNPTVVIIDDAHQFSDDAQNMSTLLTSSNPQLLIIAAGRSDDLRTTYGHWTNQLRKSQLGVLLQPNADFDGDLLSASVPRRTPVKLTTARGYACQGGNVALIQATSVME